MPDAGLVGAPNEGTAAPAPNDGVAVEGAAPKAGVPVDEAVAPKAGRLLVAAEPKAGGGFEAGTEEPKEGAGVAPNTGAPPVELELPKEKPVDPVVALPPLAAVAPNWKGDAAAVPVLWLV